MVELLCCRLRRSERPDWFPLEGREKNSEVSRDMDANGFENWGDMGLSGLIGDFLERMLRAHSCKLR